MERGSATLSEHIFNIIPGISSGQRALSVFMAASNALTLEGLKSISKSLSLSKVMSVLYIEGSEIDRKRIY